MKFSYEYHHINGITLHVGQMGPREGEKIFFLHGFPEFSQSWMQQAEFFARKGYHVIVPDQRGYNLSRKPTTIKEYGLRLLADDIAALITSVTARPVAIAGHDWGGGVAWTLAQYHPQLISKLVILNMPHLQVMRENLGRNPVQMFKSLYTLFFQIPCIPEWVCSAFNYKILEMSIVKTARANVFSKSYLIALKKSWRQPNAMSAMINWYRAFFQFPIQSDSNIAVPVLLLWGTKDFFLSKKMADESIRRCKNGWVIYLDNATHWLHHEEPDLVNAHILAFLNE